MTPVANGSLPYRRGSGTLLQDASTYKAELVNSIFGAGLAVAAAAPGTVPTPPNVMNAVPPDSNIVGVGYGVKDTLGSAVTGTLAVRVYVRHKISSSQVTRGELVPADVNGVPTDVIEVGDIVASSRARMRPLPAPGGVSIGHWNIGAGTLGCFVQKVGSPGIYYILSNNHVLADTNAGVVGDEIFQPGPIDTGASPADVIAHLTYFEPIALVSPSTPMMSSPNYMDAAIAQVVNPADANPAILNIGTVVNPPLAAALYQSVRKHGRTTFHTVGVITDISANVRVAYGKSMADFDDQLAIVGAGTMFSAGGDSGALIVDAVSLNPVGLLFAGATGTTPTTFANPIDTVLARFGVEIV